jgi:tRNA (cytidine/uridine-2'-O-)-methyltransferase
MLSPAPVKYEPQLHIVLHQPEIPHNTGNVGRTCVAVAAKLWLVRPLGFRIDAHSVRRAGLDYWQFLEWEVVDDFATLVDRLPDVGMWYFSKKAETPYNCVRYQPGDALVFGSETQGLPATMLAQHSDRSVRIPTRSEVRSLNLSNAVAVAAYEALRQWSQTDGPP